jgi:hypothetical protein
MSQSLPSWGLASCPIRIWDSEASHIPEERQKLPHEMHESQSGALPMPTSIRTECAHGWHLEHTGVTREIHQETELWVNGNLH